ncbi:MAG: phosphoglycerate mutase family protein, partial [Planctomycetota bacterium]
MLQFLVRHGQSVSNVEERVQGQEDVGLSSLGRDQAAAVAAWAARIAGTHGVAEVWTSPLERARDTAAAVAAATG